MKSFTTGLHYALKTEHRLGKWNRTHKEWKWVGKGKTVQNTGSGLTLTSYEHQQRPQDCLTNNRLEGRLMPLYVYLMGNGDTRIFYVGEEGHGEVGKSNKSVNETVYCKIMGRIHNHSDLRRLERGDNEIIGVSDGLVVNGEGSGAVCSSTRPRTVDWKPVCLWMGTLK